MEVVAKPNPCDIPTPPTIGCCSRPYLATEKHGEVGVASKQLAGDVLNEGEDALYQAFCNTQEEDEVERRRAREPRITTKDEVEVKDQIVASIHFEA